MIWLACYPTEDGGRGMAWPDVIRMGPEQLLFVLTGKETAEREARFRLMRARGQTPEQAYRDAMERQARKRKSFTGKDSLDEVEI